MYHTFSHTFSTPSHGDKKFFLTLSKTNRPHTFEGKINEDKTVRKFQLKQDDSGAWKIQPGDLPQWVHDLEPAFGERIEEIAARAKASGKQ